jgi:hypothetical protein
MTLAASLILETLPLLVFAGFGLIVLTAARQAWK